MTAGSLTLSDVEHGDQAQRHPLCEQASSPGRKRGRGCPVLMAFLTPTCILTTPAHLWGKIEWGKRPGKFRGKSSSLKTREVRNK